jgi:hypothetical protein
MKDAPLINRLHALAEERAPGPDPAFVARLGSELHQLEQVPVLTDRKPPRARRLGGSTWLRVVTLAVPAGAVALAGAFVALRPHPEHQRQVRTADNGITAPAPTNDGLQPSAGAPQQPTAPATAPQSSPTSAPPSRATTTTVEPTRHLVVPAPTDQSPQTTVVPKRPVEPTTSTTAPTTTTTTPTTTLSLKCSGGTDAGAPAVTCTWSPSTSSSFASYRLSREKPGTNRVVVSTTDNRSTTSYVDHDVQAGTGYGYWIEALDASGNVIARGTTTITCC